MTTIELDKRVLRSLIRKAIREAVAITPAEERCVEDAFIRFAMQRGRCYSPNSASHLACVGARGAACHRARDALDV